MLEELRALRRPARGAHARGAGARGVLLHRPLRRRHLALVRRARGGLSRSRTRAPTRRCSTSPTARTRTSAPPTTSRPARARTCCRWWRSSTARSCRSTTCWTWTPAASWSTSSRCRRQRSSSTTTRAACAVGADAGEAFERALATDRMSAFGGVMCFNRPVDKALAETLNAMFVELVFAPGYDDGRARGAPGQGERAHPRGLGAAAARRDRAGHQAGARRDAGPGPRRRPRDARGDAGGHRAQADRGRVGRAAVRVEGVQARALQRDRAGARPGHGRRSAPGR